MANEKRINRWKRIIFPLPKYFSNYFVEGDKMLGKQININLFLECERC